MMWLPDQISSKAIPILMLFILLGCSAEENDTIPAEVRKLKNLTILPSDIQPTHEIIIRKEQMFGGIENNQVALGHIGDVAVDESGRVFISDTQKKTIHVFNSDGQYIKQMGGEGMGPGEYGHIFDMKIQGDKLFAFDPTFFRINFYSPDSLTFDHAEGLFFQDWSDIKAIKGANPTKFYYWGNNNLLIGFDQILGENIYYYIVNNRSHSTKIIADPILLQRNDEGTHLDIELPNGLIGARKVPFGRKSLIAVSEDRHIFSAWTDQFLIKEFDSKGNYLRAWYCPYTNPPLTQTVIDSIVNPLDEASVERALNGYKAPATWPALYDLRISGQNRLWVSTIVENTFVTEWWILEQDGTLIGRFAWPKQKSIEAIKNGFIYTKESDRVSGLQTVVRYRVIVG